MLNNLSPAKGSVRKLKRVARGSSAGGGTTAGRGTKGLQARAGSKRNHRFEGGQTPLLRRQPKLGGFRNPNKVRFEAVNLSSLNALEDGKYDVPSLKARKIVRTSRPVKLLGGGKIERKLIVSVNAASKSAVKAIESAGGSVEIQNLKFKIKN